MAGVLIFALRCITKRTYWWCMLCTITIRKPSTVATGDTPDGLRNGAMAFYFIAIGICVAAIALYLALLHRLPIVCYYRNKVQCICGGAYCFCMYLTAGILLVGG